MKKITAFFIVNLLFFNVYAQDKTLKEQAIDEFKKEHYDKSIKLLEKASKETPEDAEIFYYLGWFNHYRAYDSRPLKGYNYSYSKKIFDYLNKAIELNPNYGDAKYFYGTECSVNAFLAMQNNDAKKMKYFYKLANEKGAYPNWLKEFGRNMMNACKQNAILFMGGNADFDICTYLQVCEKFRQDITIIPIGNIDRPWYVKFLKNGLYNAVKKVKLNLTEQQIMDIHPFKWQTTTIEMSISDISRKVFNLSENYKLKWEVYPDLYSDRMHSKIEGEKAKKRTYISPQRTILLQIIEDNLSERPIYFSNFCSPTFYGGLNQYFQNCGLVSYLTPIATKGKECAFDYVEIEKMLQKENLKYFRTLIDNDIPRISSITLSGYYIAFLNLLESKNSKERLALKEVFDKYLKIGYNKEFENEIANELNK